MKPVSCDICVSPTLELQLKRTMARCPESNEFVFPIMVIVRIDVIVITNVIIHIK